MQKLAFVEKLNDVDPLEDEINKEIERLPIINWLKMYKSRLMYRQSDYMENERKINVYTWYIQY